MKFSEEDIKLKLNFLEIEEEKLEFYALEVNKVGDVYQLIGNAYFGEELYKDFKIEVALIEDTDLTDPKQIIDLDWDWYDFKFD